MAKTHVASKQEPEVPTRARISPERREHRGNRSATDNRDMGRRHVVVLLHLHSLARNIQGPVRPIDLSQTNARLRCIGQAIRASS
jgi:hypothetical protein